MSSVEKKTILFSLLFYSLVFQSSKTKLTICLSCSKQNKSRDSIML